MVTGWFFSSLKTESLMTGPGSGQSLSFSAVFGIEEGFWSNFAEAETLMITSGPKDPLSFPPTSKVLGSILLAGFSSEGLGSILLAGFSSEGLGSTLMVGFSSEGLGSILLAGFSSEGLGSILLAGFSSGLGSTLMVGSCFFSFLTAVWRLW